MTRAHRCAALFGAVVVLAAGCGHTAAVPPASSHQSVPVAPPSSAAAASASEPPTPTVPTPSAFKPVISLLRPAKMPVYLPTWLPPLPAGQSYYFTGQADAGSYSVGIAMSQQPAAAQTLPDLPNTDQIGSIAGGPPGHLGPDPTLKPPSGPGQSVDVNTGVHGTFYPQPPGGDYSLIQWRVGGWTYQVADVTGLGSPASRLVPYAQKLLADVPTGGTPVTGVATGTVVQTLAPDGAPTWVLWQRGGWAYRIETHSAPAVRMASTMVHIAV